MHLMLNGHVYYQRGPTEKRTGSNIGDSRQDLNMEIILTLVAQVVAVHGASVHALFKITEPITDI